MRTGNIGVTLKFTKKWFYTPAYFLSVLYIFLGGDTEKAGDYIANNCFDIKVMK